ncbi:MAG: hypothetical protein ABI633_03980 [Burkholderiales bacterium]
MATQNSFFRRFVNREPKPAPDDPADMGTAFGLEASLGAADEFNADEEVIAEGHPARERAPMDWLAQRHKPRR